MQTPKEFSKRLKDLIEEGDLTLNDQLSQAAPFYALHKTTTEWCLFYAPTSYGNRFLDHNALGDVKNQLRYGAIIVPETKTIITNHKYIEKLVEQLPEYELVSA